MTATERMVRVGNVNLHLGEYGDPANPPMVLTHGLSTQFHTWDVVAEHFSKAYHVVGVDLRGHGDSDWTRSGYWLADFVGDLAGLLRELDLKDVVYIGHSFGARIGVAFAARHPDLVGHLVLSDSGPQMATTAAKNVQNRQSPTSSGRPLSFRTLDEVGQYYKDLNPEWTDDVIAAYAEHQVRPNWAGRLVLKADPELFWLTGSAVRKEVTELWEDAAHIKCPSLLCWATRGVLDQELVDRMARTIPNLEVVLFDSGHGISRERTREFLETVEAFLGNRVAQ